MTTTQKEHRPMKRADQLEVGNTILILGKARTVEEVTATSWRIWLWVGIVRDGDRIPVECQPDDEFEVFEQGEAIR